MAVVIVMVLVGVLALSVIVALALRTLVRDSSRVEERLHSPGVHTLAYAVPNGQDPAVLMAAVQRAGLASVVDCTGPRERILVECGESDRDRVREALEHAGSIEDGRQTVVGRVVFEDEG